MRKIALIGVVGALLVGGCSSGGASAPASAAAAMTASDLAGKAGCGSSWKPGSTSPGIKEGGRCQIDGVDVYVYTFADDAARDSWLQIAKGAGAIGTFGQGSSWVIQGLQDAPARKAIAAAGGTVVG